MIVFIVTAQGDERAKANPEGIENLGTSVFPYLKGLPFLTGALLNQEEVRRLPLDFVAFQSVASSNRESRSALQAM